MVADSGDEDGRGPTWGICLSGGGIRSASFCLGALQHLQKKGLLNGPKRAHYITSVSGGSYIAAAIAILNHGKFKNDQGDPRRPVKPGSLAAFAPGSPEERYLRDHTRYLTHGFGGPVAALWRLFLSIFLNFALLFIAVLAVAVPIGWIYGWRARLLRACLAPVATSCSRPQFQFPIIGWGLLPVVILAGAALLVGLVWLVEIARKEQVQQGLQVASLVLIGLAALWIIGAVVVPVALQWLRVSVGSVGGSSTGHNVVAAKQSAGAVAAAAGGGTLASVLAALFGARVARTIEAGWQHVPTAAKTQLWTRTKNLLLRLRAPAINFLVLLIGPATIAAVLMLGLYLGSLYPVGTAAGGWWPLGGIAIGSLLLGLAWLFANLTAWSLHPFYRERLAAAFCLKRFRAAPRPSERREGWESTISTEQLTPDGSREVAADRRHARHPAYLSELDGMADDFPELVLCAAANVSNYGATPTGHRVTSFVFSRAKVGGALLGYWPAATYESVLGHFRPLADIVTLPAAVAMSGAAVSPEMGRMTRAPLRFLLTMANVRLGVWFPNPSRLAWFEYRLREGEALLPPKVSTMPDGRASDKKDGPATWFVRKFHRLAKPRISHLMFEMFGKNKVENRYLYITDGGHYENLGLIEQLRRKSLYIFCIDASGEQQDGFGTIAAAVALAYSELGCRIDLRPDTMAPSPQTTDDRKKLGLRPVVRSTFCAGNVHYADGTVGRIVVVKTGVTDDAPLDVAEFYACNPRFPCDPTIDQLYTADRFDAYRSLGSFAAEQALTALAGDFQRFLRMGAVAELDMSKPPATWPDGG